MYPELSRAARFIVGGVIGLLIVLLLTTLAAGQEDTPAEKRGWWGHPRVQACCSVADAVFADQWHFLPDGSVLATVTEGTVQTMHWVDSVIGRTYHVPAAQVIDVPGNPTGRALLFVSPTTHNLYCFATGPMI